MSSAQTTIIAHENVLNRMIATGRSAGRRAWPTETFFGDDKEVFFNGEAVQILHQPAAQTDGDSIVFFRRSDVIATGDIFTTTMYPFIDAPSGGSINGDHRRAEPDHRYRDSRSQGAGGRPRGTVTFSVHFDAGDLDEPHQDASSPFNVSVVARPDHT